MYVRMTGLWEINGEMFGADTLEGAIEVFYATTGRSPAEKPNYVRPVKIDSGCSCIYVEDDVKVKIVCAPNASGSTGVMDGEVWACGKENKIEIA